jgi:hypothetical protein
MMIGTGIGPSSPEPAVCTMPGMPGIGAPSESISASPRAAFSVASVGMNACGILPFTSMIPFSAPTAAPVASIIGITSGPPKSQP